jgi:hypothetical protein
MAARPATSIRIFASASRCCVAWTAAALLVACSAGPDDVGQLTAATFATTPGGSGSDDGTSSGDDASGGTTSASSTHGTDGAGCGVLADCEGECVDFQSDIENCGGCGITCAIPNAMAACNQGECGLVECLEGWSNCDGQLASGCESESNCQPGAPCQTVCGSVGVTTCTACDPVCQTTEEVCNAMDDDCNDACDEGPLPGCRVGVHRAYGGTLGHLYTLDINEAQSGGFTLEAQNFFHVYVPEVAGLEPLHRCLKGNGKRLYTTAADCEGIGQLESILGHVAPDGRCGAQPLYRVWQQASDAHFYTTSAAERDNAVINLGYTDQGVVGHVWSSL